MRTAIVFGIGIQRWAQIGLPPAPRPSFSLESWWWLRRQRGCHLCRNPLLGWPLVGMKKKQQNFPKTKKYSKHNLFFSEHTVEPPYFPCIFGCFVNIFCFFVKNQVFVFIFFQQRDILATGSGRGEDEARSPGHWVSRSPGFFAEIIF